MMWRKCVANFVIALVFLLGAGFVLYPELSDLWNSFHSSYVVSGYEETVSDLGQQKCSQLRDAAQTYNQTLIGDANRWEITTEKSQEYKKLLNVMDSGMIGYVEIPSIEVSLPIYHTTEDSYLQVGAGHLEGSSLPIGGAGTHCVIVGHRGLPEALLFTRLDELAIGDLFYISCLDEEHTYEVDQIIETEPDDFSKLEIVPDKDYCTLLTCTPYGINTRRLLVRGVRVETTDDEIQNSESDATLYQRKCRKIYLFFCMCLIGIITIVFLYFKRKRKNKSLTQTEIQK